MQKPHFSRLLLLMLGLACLPVSAQDASSPTADKPQIPADEFDRGTPRRSVDGFLAAAGMGDYRDSIGVVLEDGKESRLYIQKVPRGDGVSIWKISNTTVSLIPKLYRNYGYPEGVEDLRRTLPDVTFLGYELFKWVVVLAIGILAYGVIFLIAISIGRVFGDPDSPSRRRVYRFLVNPFGIWLVILSIHTTTTMLGRSITAEAWEPQTFGWRRFQAWFLKIAPEKQL